MELTEINAPHCEACGKRIIFPNRFYLVATWHEQRKNFDFVKSEKYGVKSPKLFSLFERITPTQKFACCFDCAVSISRVDEYVLYYNTKRYGFNILMCYQRQVEPTLKKVGRFWMVNHQGKK